MLNPRILVFVSVSLIAALIGLWFGQRVFRESTAETPKLQAGLLYPTPKTIAPFRLVDADNAAFTEKNLAGRWSLLFFGFTRCPDICPTTLQTMAQLDKRLSERAPNARPQYVFVSLDPERDSPTALKQYAAFFSEKIVAVTGAESALAPFARQMGIAYMKTPLRDGDYTIDHSAQMALTDPEGNVAGLFRPPFDIDKIAQDLVVLQRP